MYDLTNFSLRDMTECGVSLRKLGIGAQSMEEVANRIVYFFYKNFWDETTNNSAFALVRVFKTHSYSELLSELQQVASTLSSGAEIHETTKCLTLLASAGILPEWNHRQGSQGHQAIPLVSEEMVARSPMIAQLIHQLGLEIRNVLTPDPDLLTDLEQRTYNVFHVQDAVDSPYVPAQEEFIVPYGVQSVLGFGGVLPSGNLMAVILFSKLRIDRDTADMFKSLALNVKIAMLPFDRTTVFA